MSHYHPIKVLERKEIWWQTFSNSVEKSESHHKFLRAQTIGDCTIGERSVCWRFRYFTSVFVTTSIILFMVSRVVQAQSFSFVWSNKKDNWIAKGYPFADANRGIQFFYIFTQLDCCYWEIHMSREWRSYQNQHLSLVVIVVCTSSGWGNNIYLYMIIITADLMYRKN